MACLAALELQYNKLPSLPTLGPTFSPTHIPPPNGLEELLISNTTRTRKSASQVINALAGLTKEGLRRMGQKHITQQAMNSDFGWWGVLSVKDIGMPIQTSNSVRVKVTYSGFDLLEQNNGLKEALRRGFADAAGIKEDLIQIAASKKVINGRNRRRTQEEKASTIQCTSSYLRSGKKQCPSEYPLCIGYSGLLKCPSCDQVPNPRNTYTHNHTHPQTNTHTQSTHTHTRTPTRAQTHTKHKAHSTKHKAQSTKHKAHMNHSKHTKHT